MKIVEPPKPYPEGSELVVYGKDQPQYLPLPAIRHNDEMGCVTSCWYLSFKERLKLLFTGRVYLQLATFGHSIQPQLMSLRMKNQPKNTPFKGWRLK